MESDNKIGERIKKVITDSKVKKIDFARTLKIDPSYVSKLVSGLSKPSNRLISDICEEYRISETWLRTGEGDMFQKILLEDEYTYHAMKIGQGEHDFIKNAIVKFGRLKKEDQDIVNSYLESLLDSYK